MFGFVSFRGRAQVLLAAVGAFFFAVSDAAAITLDDVTVWVGTGESRAGLVLDWHDGKDPLVFGYRFDGPAVGQDMFDALLAQRPELYAKVGQFGFGQAPFGIGVDRDSDGFSISDGSTTVADIDFTDGLLQATTATADGSTAVDSDDSYLEGWFTGFWGYYVSDGASDWGFASFGMTEQVLSDGDWNGYGYNTAPTVSVPEPTSAALFALAGAALLRRRRHD